MRFILPFMLYMASVSCRNINKTQINSYIMNGKDEDIRSVPYQLALYIEGRSYCGAVIISKKAALTVTQCVFGYDSDRVILGAGSSKDDGSGTLHTVKEIIYHDDCWFHNIAILVVAKEFHFGDLIKKIQIASQNPSVGSLAQISGWGMKYCDGNGDCSRPHQLQSARVYIRCPGECSYYHDSLICAGDPYNGRTFCAGDDGGPLVYEKKLIGLAAYVGCVPEKPAVYINMVYYKEWIESKLLLLEV